MERLLTVPQEGAQNQALVLIPLGEFMEKVEIRSIFLFGNLLQAIFDFGEGKIGNLDANGVAGTINLFTAIEEHVVALDMDVTSSLLKQAKANCSEKTTFADLRVIAECMKTSALSELEKVFVGYIPNHRARYWKQTKPFGDKVYESFPSIRSEIISAGNCYAVEQFDACVFHLMRAVERGLRAIAKERGIKKIGKTKVEWNDWGTIISAITKKANEIEQKSRGPAKDKALEFYRGAVGEMLAFKDAYRNYVMHDRSDPYDYHQTASAYHRVCEFLQRLAERLSESNSRAIKWGK